MNKEQLAKVRDALLGSAGHNLDCGLFTLNHNGNYLPCDCGFSEALTIIDKALAAPEQEGWTLREVLFDNGSPIAHREPAAPEQEPVAWTVGGLITDFSRDFSAYKTKTYTIPLYRHPAPQSAQPVASISKVGLEMITKEGLKYATMRSLKMAAEYPTECDVLLYTAPPSREWQGLSDEEVYKHWMAGERAFARHQTLVKGQQMTFADNVEHHVYTAISEALRAKNSGEQA